MPITVVTIGVYGFDETGFIRVLRRAGVDTFCDIRFRRAMRGAGHSFANHRRLESSLEAAGIRYLTFPELAPSAELRRWQETADRAQRLLKRERVQLDTGFVQGYEQECLSGFDSAAFVARLGSSAGVVALGCVEGPPAACHRSLLAARLERDLGARILHLLPPLPDA